MSRWVAGVACRFKGLATAPLARGVHMGVSMNARNAFAALSILVSAMVVVGPVAAQPRPRDGGTTIIVRPNNPPPVDTGSGSTSTNPPAEEGPRGPRSSGPFTPGTADGGGRSGPFTPGVDGPAGPNRGGANDVPGGSGPFSGNRGETPAQNLWDTFMGVLGSIWGFTQKVSEVFYVIEGIKGMFGLFGDLFGGSKNAGDTVANGGVGNNIGRNEPTMANSPNAATEVRTTTDGPLRVMTSETRAALEAGSRPNSARVNTPSSSAFLRP